MNQTKTPKTPKASDHAAEQTDILAPFSSEAPDADTKFQRERVQELVKARGLKLIDFCFTELTGRPWRLTMSADSLNERTFSNGTVVDGRQVGGGWQGLMSILPDPSATFIDSTAATPTLTLVCDIVRAPRGSYPEDSRSVLKRAEAHFKAVEPGSSWTVGAEVEFFLLEKDGTLAPDSVLRETLREIWDTLARAEIQVDWFRIGPPRGVGRVQMRSGGALRTADQIMVYKNVVRHVASRRGLVAKFLAKAAGGDGVANMFVHHAVWRDGVNRFHDADGWAYTSELCRGFAAGLLAHAPALAALCAPTMNSYRRLVPGLGPTELCLSNTRSSAVCRVPAGTTGPAPAARRVKFCAGDPSANQYLALAAMVMAGLDGVKRKLEPVIDPTGDAETLPHSLEHSLEFLRRDRQFLLEGGVFTDALLEAFIGDRLSHVRALKPQPHPAELAMDALDG